VPKYLEEEPLTREELCQFLKIKMPTLKKALDGLNIEATRDRSDRRSWVYPIGTAQRIDDWLNAPS